MSRPAHLGVLPAGVLEIGGTHVTAALVRPDTFALVLGSRRRYPLDAHADAASLLATLVEAGTGLAVDGPADWGIALPGPFDYTAGVAWFRGVGKFESLYGIDVGAVLRDGLRPRRLSFLNDADAFVLGEWAVGALSGTRRCAGFTLGTGIGSGFVADGALVHAGPGVPPAGRINDVEVDGRPLEDIVSRRAIRRAYEQVTADPADVAEIAARARAGEPAAVEVLRVAFGRLGSVLGPRVDLFGAERVVMGGSMAASWELFRPWFDAGVRDAGAREVATVIAVDAERSALVGAARYATADLR